MAQGYDLSALKRIDSFDNFEVQARTIILFVVAVSATIILDDLIWVWWFRIWRWLLSWASSQ